MVANFPAAYSLRTPRNGCRSRVQNIPKNEAASHCRIPRCDGILSASVHGGLAFRLSEAYLHGFLQLDQALTQVWFSMRIALAFRAFFAVLFQAEAAKRIRLALEPESTSEPKLKPTPEPKPKGVPPTARDVPASPPRSEALTLLSVLQRDARLLDLVGESLDSYSDEQIGGAARNVLRDTQKSLDRMLGLRPVSDKSEGQPIDIPGQASPIRWRVLGAATATSGTIAHAGWMATRFELPKWTGNREDAMVLSPIEVDAGQAS
jgi:hypothetical protein